MIISEVPCETAHYLLGLNTLFEHLQGLFQLQLLQRQSRVTVYLDHVGRLTPNKPVRSASIGSDDLIGFTCPGGTQTQVLLNHLHRRCR